ncbi:FeoB small GTPase domain-containing protein [Tissierella sp. P1]|uniref:FeoB small GTPase domain-containing protein n=1 Tax=Tissierella sp. P1 TaxID=1280483 RepID=UPI001F31845E|nr:FeoB small GTPase domain-containing protein [Tissierella sp. P1]
MGLTNTSTGLEVLEQELKIEKTTSTDKIIALAGNPNVGKSTVFNNLTGLNQHTGNWPGKTVTNAHGNYYHKDNNFILVDIPGTYSLMANSIEEEVARDFICFGNPDATVIVVDATCLERNLNLVLQTLEITSKVVVCVNLMDEAKRKNIFIDLEELSKQLGVPVVGTSAVKGRGLQNLMDSVYDVAFNEFSLNPLNIQYEELIEKAISKVELVLKPIIQDKLNTRWVALKLIDGDITLLNSINKYLGFNLNEQNEIINEVHNSRNFLDTEGISHNILRDKIVSHLVNMAESVSNKVVSFENKNHNNFDRKIDKYLTSKNLEFQL